MPTAIDALRAVALCLVPAFLLNACASASTREDPISFQAFEAADVDHDGKLSLAEAETIAELKGRIPPVYSEGRPVDGSASFERLFDRLDTDHSGLLSWNEIRAGRFPKFRAPPIPNSPNDR